MIALHKSFRSQDNLIASLYVPTIIDVATQTAKQFTAEEIFQGGLNDYKFAIEDQAKNGIKVTVRKQVLSSIGVTQGASAGQSKATSSTTEKDVYVWKAVPRLDKNRNEIRTSNPLEKYGVVVTQVNLGEPIAEETLEKLLSDKKALVAKKITSIQKQENAKADIETEKLEGEAKRVKAEQIKLIEADAEIIEKRKEKELETLQAEKEIIVQNKEKDLAVINKQKELEIAQANEGIQKANAIAASHQATAIKEVGLAEATVKKAKYDAVRKDILMLEVEKVTKTAFAKAYELQGVNMPNSVYMSGGNTNGTPSKMDDLLGFKLMESMSKVNTVK